MMQRRRRQVFAGIASALASAAVLPCALAAATTFHVVPGAEDNEVIFESKATLESFKGKTDRITGLITADLTDLRGPIAVRIAVDLASLDTGIGKRNAHMRDNHLETDKYPEAIFTADRIVTTSAAALNPGQTVRVRLAGILALHGVEREVTYDAELQSEPDGTLLVRSEFMVSLAAHAIERPQFLVLKLADEQKVSVRLKAKSE